MLLRSDVISALAVVAAIGLALQSDLGDEQGAEGVALETRQAVSFSEDVMPLFETHCWECHSEENAELGLKLDTYEGLMLGSDYGTVLEPGDAAGSLLIDMVESGDMPEDGDPVPPEDLEVIKTWIDEGAENN
jgi:cytochrome c